jgi:two-component system sensor histidine kinase and response regulator WspE
MRAVLVDIAGEPFAFPLARLERVVRLSCDEVRSIEGRQYFPMGDQHIGLIVANQILQLESRNQDKDLAVLIIGEKSARYGLVVDRFIGEQQLVVRPLDPRLGKVPNISAAALMPDGSPVLIIDVDDLLHNVKNMNLGQRLPQVHNNQAGSVEVAKRILVVDDSLTVRELERKLLSNHGYVVDVAIDGLDGWNAVHGGQYDLVVTDVDMPRLDGVELVRLIRKDERLKALPVMIVSYKDRDEDRQKGLEAGADYYLTKSSFHDETLLRAVSDLIGAAS